jgi:hypothetical protein
MACKGSATTDQKHLSRVLSEKVDHADPHDAFKIRFSSEFPLHGFDAPHPAGEFQIEYYQDRSRIGPQLQATAAAAGRSGASKGNSPPRAENVFVNQCKPAANTERITMNIKDNNCAWNSEISGSTGGRQDRQYGRRVEADRSWTVYHVFTGVPADIGDGAMTRLTRMEATDWMMVLNRPDIGDCPKWR